MVGRYDDQERYYRERERGRYDDRYDVFGQGDDRERWSGSESRAFDRGSDRGRDRVFGERESGVEYNRPQRGPYGADYSGRDDNRYSQGDWQDRDYQGVSPAARRGDYDVGYRERPYMSHQGRDGGRFYGDDGRQRVYAEEQRYGERGYDSTGRRFGSYDADRRWEREMRRPAGSAAAHGDYPGSGYGGVYSGGTGGYDYERGYGDAGRNDGRHEGFEDRARDAGEFLRRTGQKISNWFADATSDTAYGRDERYETYRGARGLGPKDYKRSDDRVSDDVNQRLADDPWLDASHVNVTVMGGEVTLSGTVESREAKHRAERIVEDLSGVNHVQNNLRVQADSYFTSAGRGYGHSASEASIATASSQPVKDVTDGNTSPPAQKRN